MTLTTLTLGEAAEMQALYGLREWVMKEAFTLNEQRLAEIEPHRRLELAVRQEAFMDFLKEIEGRIS